MAEGEKSNGDFLNRGLQVIPALAVVGGILWAAFGGLSNANRAGTELKDFKADVAAQFQDMKNQNESNIKSLRNDIGSQFLDIKGQLSFLPDQRAAANQLEKRIQENIVRNAEQDAHIGKTEQDIYRLQSDLANLIRASAVPLPRR